MLSAHDTSGHLRGDANAVKTLNRHKDSGLEGITIAGAGPTVRAASCPFRSRIREATGVAATVQGPLQDASRNIHCGCVASADHDSGFDRVKSDDWVGLIRIVLGGLAREGHGVRARR